MEGEEMIERWKRKIEGRRRGGGERELKVE